MTVDEMYEDIRVLLRGEYPAQPSVRKRIEAIKTVLKKAGCQILNPMDDRTIAVRCDNIPLKSIKDIDFLANSVFLHCNVIATILDDRPVPFIQICEPY